MDADDWDGADLRQMLTLAAGRVSDRKLDLFNLWCCHALRPYLRDRRSVAAVRYAERHVDEGWAGGPEWTAIWLAAKQVVEELAEWAHRCPRTPAEHRARRVYAQAALVAQQTVSRDLPSRGVLPNSAYTANAYAWANDDSGPAAPDDSPAIQALREAHLRLQEAVFRDIVGDPFRPVDFDPRWRTSDAVGLAGRHTRTGCSSAYRCSPTPSWTPGATTGPSSAIAPAPARTPAAAGWWTGCSRRAEVTGPRRR